MTPRLLVAGVLSAGLLLAGPAPAQEERPTHPVPEEAERMAREAVEKLLRALETLFESIPQYDAPVINENGDIIIRRRNPPKGAPEGEPEKVEPEEPIKTRT